MDGSRGCSSGARVPHLFWPIVCNQVPMSCRDTPGGGALLLLFLNDNFCILPTRGFATCTGEKQDEMGAPLGKNRCKQTNKESRCEKTSRTQEKGKSTAKMRGLREEGHEKIGGRMKEKERPIENYGKKEQKEWLDNTLPDTHPCTAGKKEEEHTLSFVPQ